MPAFLPIDPTWFIRPDGYDASRTIHGVGHTARVLTHAREIAAELGVTSWQLDALEYAAAWHDIGRTNDGRDYYHGATSAGKVVGLGLHFGIDPLVVETALFVVTHHCGDEDRPVQAAGWSQDPESILRVFRILKDADGLDRVRLGRGGLDPAQLRHDFSRTRVARARELLRELP